MQINQSVTTIPQTPAPSTPEAPAEAGESEAKPTPPAAAETPAPTGTPEAEAKPDEDQEMLVAKRFEAVAKKEARNRRMEAEWKTKIETAAEKERRAEELIAKYEEALSDPIKFYLDNGGDPVSAARRFSQPETEEQKEIRKLKEAWQKKEENEAKQRKEWEEQTAKIEEHRKMREFVGSINPEGSPYLTSMYEAQEVPDLVKRLLNSDAEIEVEEDGERVIRKVTLLERFRYEHGRGPTNNEIRECLEYEAGLRAKRIVEAHLREQERLRASQAPPEQVSEQDEGPRGISNQHAATTSSGKPKPKSLDERRAQIRRSLAAALEAEASERTDA